MAKMKLNPDQIPLITPDSDWKIPTELPVLSNVDEIGLDTETKDEGLASGRGPGWAFGAGYVAGVGVAWREDRNIRKIYVPIRHPETQCFPKEQVARWVTDITRKKRVVMFNAGYDIGWLQTDMGVPVPPLIDDASCMAMLIDENRQPTSAFPKAYSLDAVAHWRGVPGKDLGLLYETANCYGVAKSNAIANIWRYPARYAGPYGEQDPATTLMLAEDMRPELARQGLLRAYALEMRLVPLIHAMRRRGIRIDVEGAEKLRDALFERCDAALAFLSSELREKVGMDEIRSNGWLVRKFEQENVGYATKDDKASFERDWMRQGYVGRYEPGRVGHWLPLRIAEAKQCYEMAHKFVDGYLLDYAHLGRVHASINQFKSEDGGTRSHRISYSDPPLQQAPSRPESFIEEWTLTGDVAKAYRGCFRPEEGELWFSPDYSQQEYRHIVSDAETMECDRATEAAEKYRRDPKTDFHNLVVELTGLTRRRAKDCNFAKAFGAGVPKFALMTGMSLDEAKDTMSQYDTEMPFVRQLSQLCEKLAQNRGYIKLIDDARCHFDEWEAAWLDKAERDRGWREGWRMGECSLEEARERAATKDHPWFGKRLKRAKTHKAMNRRIQGSAARQTKMAMAQCWEEGFVPLLQMHDELSFSLIDPRAGERIVEIMATVYKGSVPFLVDAEWGSTWGDAKHTYAEAAVAMATGAGDHGGAVKGRAKRRR